VLRQNAQHTQREVRGVSYQETEPLVAEWNECRICQGYRGCAPGTLIDQRHLAEDAALAQCIYQAVVDADFDSSAFDDEEEFRRWVALSENDIACFEAAYGIARLNQEIKVDVRSNPWL